MDKIEIGFKLKNDVWYVVGAWEPEEGIRITYSRIWEDLQSLNYVIYLLGQSRDKYVKSK